MAHGPIQAGDRHGDDDQRGREERHFAPQQPETRVDISGKGVEKLVDDGHVIHGVSSGSAGTAGAMPSAGSSKLGGIGGRSVKVWYSSGPAWPEKKRRRKASAAARQARSEERRVRQAWFNTCKIRVWPDHLKKKIEIKGRKHQ